MAWPEGDSRAGRGGATRPGRIPDGSGRGGGVRRQCGYHGPHRGPPTPHGRGPRWSRVGRVCWQQQWAGLAVGIVGVALVVGGDVRVAEAPLWAYAMPFGGMAGLVAATLVERKEYLRKSG